MSRRAWTIALAALALVGCHDAESIDPLDAGSTTTGGDAGPAPDAGPFVRSVTVRSPFGAAPLNLFADGDFEWSVSGSTGSQFAWLTFAESGAGGVLTRIETGGLCKSGLRCAVIDKDSVMLIRGAAAPDNHAMNVSVSVKPPKGGACNMVRAIALPCDTLTTPQYIIAAPLSAGSDGYCTHSGAIAGSTSSICLYIDALTLPDNETALVDDAMMLDSGSADNTAAAVVFHAEPALVSRLANIHDLIHGQMPVGRPARRPRLPSP